LAHSAAAAEIRWSGAESCQRDVDVAEQVQAMTERALAQVSSHDFQIEVSEERAGFRLKLTTTTLATGAFSERVLQARSCEDVTNAAAVAISLTIGNAAEAAEPTPVPDPQPAAPLASAESTIEPARPRPTAVTPSARRLTVMAGAGARADSSATPHVTPGAALWLAGGWQPLRLELEGGLFMPSSSVDSTERGGTFQLVYGAALLCATRSFGMLAGQLCGGHELGQLTAEGEGVPNPRLQNTLWQAGRAELRVAVPLGRGLSVVGGLGAALVLSRHAFVLDGVDQVHRPALVSLRAAAGLELEL
jgi:hypothetical protein